MEATETQDRLLDADAVAHALGLSVGTIRNLRSAGALPEAMLLGRAVRWRASDVGRIVRGEVLIPSLKRKSTPTTPMGEGTASDVAPPGTPETAPPPSPRKPTRRARAVRRRIESGPR